MTETLQRRGTLLGHSGWVTQIATNPKYPDMLLSSSRGMYLYFSEEKYFNKKISEVVSFCAGE